MSGIEAIVGLAAGGAGFLSLAIQLGEYSAKLMRLYKDTKDAPRIIESIAFDLGLLDLGLKQLEKFRLEAPGSDAIMRQCFEECRLRSIEIEKVVTEISTGLSRHKKLRGMTYAAFKERDILDLLARVERFKSTLTTAYTIFDRTLQQQLQEQLQKQSSAFALQLNAIQSQVSLGTSSKSQQIAVVGQVQPASTSLVPASQNQLGSQIESSATVSGNELILTPKQKRPKRSTRIRIRLPTLLYRRVWDLTFDTSISGWNMTLQTYNIVPSGSRVFELCREGDLDGLRKLIDRDEASLLDCYASSSFDHTLLDEAAAYRHVDICAYILSTGITYPDHSRIMYDALGIYCHLDSYSSEPSFEREQMHRLFFRDDRFDLSQFPGTSSIFLEICLSPLSFQIIMQSEPGVDLTCLSDKVGPAFEMEKITSPNFLKCLGLEESDPELAALGSSGITILHYIAMRFSLDRILHLDGLETSSWDRMCTSVLRNGADSHAITSKEWFLGNDSFRHYLVPRGSTPLMLVLQTPLRLLGSVLKAWVNAVQKGGIDLCSYAEREMQIWEEQGFLPHLVSEREDPDKSLQRSGDIGNIWLEEIRFGPVPEDWVVELSIDYCVPIYELRQPPGAFFQSDPRIPPRIIWEPGETDGETYGWHLKEEIYVCAFWHDLEPLISRFQGDSHPGSDATPIVDLVNGVQDDTGVVISMLDRASKKRPHAKRSLSQPPNFSRRKMDYLEHKVPNRRWLGGFHLCPRDMKWNFGCTLGQKRDAEFLEQTMELRYCCEGVSRDRCAQGTSSWASASFLFEASDCRDGYIVESSKGHTCTIECPYGCGKFDVNKLAVPEELEDHHPWAENDLSEFGK